mgnify:CR=1 FL=1
MISDAVSAEYRKTEDGERTQRPVTRGKVIENGVITNRLSNQVNLGVRVVGGNFHLDAHVCELR